MTKSLISSLNLFVLAVLIGGSVMVFGNLPAEIPVHFGGSGQPDRFAEKSWFSWMLLPAIAVGLTAMMYGIATLLRRIPDQLNMPDPKKYKALPLTDQLKVVDLQSTFLAEIALGLNVMLMLLQAGSYGVAVGHYSGLPWYAGLGIAGFVVHTIVVCVRAMRSSNKLVDQLSSAQPAA